MAIQLMAPLDVVLMTAEPLGNPMHVAVLLVLTPPPGAEPSDVDRLYDDAVASGVEVDPRLLRHPHRGFDTGGLWAWRPAEDSSHPTRPPAHSPDRQPRRAATSRSATRTRRLSRKTGRCGRPSSWTGCRRLIRVLHQGAPRADGRRERSRLVEGSMSTDPDEGGSPPYFGVRTHGTNVATPGVVSCQDGRWRWCARRPPRPPWRRVVEGTIVDIARGLTTDTTVPSFRAPRTRLNGPLTATGSFTAAPGSASGFAACRRRPPA